MLIRKILERTPMNSLALRAWFDKYLHAFASGAAGESEFRELLSLYAVPLLVITPGGVITLTSEQEVCATIGGQVEGLRGRDYASTSGVFPLNESNQF